MDRPRPPSEGDSAVISIFAAVGEHRDDPTRLLLLGEDGRYYALALPDGPTTPVEPGEEWVVDEAPPALADLAG